MNASYQQHTYMYSPPLARIISNVNPNHTLPPLLKVDFNIILLIWFHTALFLCKESSIFSVNDYT